MPLHLWGGWLPSSLLSLLALGLFLFSSFSGMHAAALRAQVLDALSPLLYVIDAPFRQAGVYVGSVTGLADLQAENERLSAENKRLREWYQTALLLQAQNEELQKLFHIQLEPQNQFITARVIADSGSSYVQSLLVLAGAAQGVDKGQVALGADGVVGRVIEAGEKAARILLLTDMNSRIPVTVQGTGDRAVLAGNNEALPVLMHLPQNAEVKEGARVVTSGHGGLFPPGLPVGTIVRDAEGVWSVEPYADIERLVYVRVVNRSATPGLKESDF